MKIEVDINDLEKFMKWKCQKCYSSKYDENCPVLKYRKLLDGDNYNQTKICWVKKMVDYIKEESKNAT